jgi:hypothetical protein
VGRSRRDLQAVGDGLDIMNRFGALREESMGPGLDGAARTPSGARRERGLGLVPFHAPPDEAAGPWCRVVARYIKAFSYRSTGGDRPPNRPNPHKPMRPRNTSTPPTYTARPHISPHSAMTHGSFGRLAGPVATASIFRRMSIPSPSTRPNTTCLPSSQSHFWQVKKNWQPVDEMNPSGWAGTGGLDGGWGW